MSEDGEREREKGEGKENNTPRLRDREALQGESLSLTLGGPPCRLDSPFHTTIIGEQGTSAGT